MPKFYKPVKTNLQYVSIQSGFNVSVKDRGLDGDCENGGKHDWLLLPKEEGQKQYLVCLKCTQHSHT